MTKGKICGNCILLCLLGIYVLLSVFSQISSAMAATSDDGKPIIATEQGARYRLATDTIKFGNADSSPSDPIMRREKLLNDEINQLRDDITSLESTVRLLILGEVLLFALLGLLLFSLWQVYRRRLGLGEAAAGAEEAVFVQREAMGWASRLITNRRHLTTVSAVSESSEAKREPEVHTGVYESRDQSTIETAKGAGTESGGGLNQSQHDDNASDECRESVPADDAVEQLINQVVSDYNQAQAVDDGSHRAFTETYRVYRFKVYNAMERRIKPDVAPRFVTDPGGAYLAIELPETPDFYIVLPRLGLPYEETVHGPGAMGQVFPRSEYRAGDMYQSIHVVRPAIFRRTSELDWEFIQSGSIKFVDREQLAAE